MANNILRGLLEETGGSVNVNGAQKRPRETEEEGPVKKYVQILLPDACKWLILSITYAAD